MALGVLPPPHGAEGGQMTNHRHSDVSICRRVKLRLLEGGTCRGGLVHVQECGHHNEKASSGGIFYHSGVMRLHVPLCPGYISKVKPSTDRERICPGSSDDDQLPEKGEHWRCKNPSLPEIDPCSWPWLDLLFLGVLDTPSWPGMDPALPPGEGVTAGPVPCTTVNASDFVREANDATD